MKKIELDPYELKDLKNYLIMLKKLLPEKDPYITNSHDGWITKKYHLLRIDHLLDLLDGKIMSNGYIRNTKQALVNNTKNIKKERYRELKTEDFNLLEYLEDFFEEKR